MSDRRSEHAETFGPGWEYDQSITITRPLDEQLGLLFDDHHVQRQIDTEAQNILNQSRDLLAIKEHERNYLLPSDTIQTCSVKRI